MSRRVAGRHYESRIISKVILQIEKARLRRAFYGFSQKLVHSVRILIASLSAEVIIRLAIGLCTLKEGNKTKSEWLPLKLALVEGNSIFG